MSCDTILQGPGDWRVWIRMIRGMTPDKTWDLVNPSKEQKPAPLSHPVEPTFEDAKRSPTGGDSMAETDHEFLEQLWSKYEYDLSRYESQQEELTRIRSRIDDSVGRHHYLIAREHDIAKQLSILRDSVEPTAEEEREIVTHRYCVTLEGLGQLKPHHWVCVWQNAYRDAQELDLPFTKTLSATRHFLQIVASVNPYQADLWEFKIEDLAQSGRPDWQNEIPSPIKISNSIARKWGGVGLHKIAKNATQQYVCYESGTLGPRTHRKALLLERLTRHSNRTGQTDLFYHNEVLDLYSSLCEGAQGHKLENYIKSWRKVMSEGQRLEVLDISRFFNTSRFLRAIQSIYPSFSAHWWMEIEERGNSNNTEDAKKVPDAITISEIFQRCYKRKVLGPIDTVFDIEAKSYNLELFETPEARKARRVKPIKPAGSPRSTCLCGKQHFYAECFYLVDEIRPAYWMPFTDVASKVLKQLQDPEVKARVREAIEKMKETRHRRPLEVPLPPAIPVAASNG